MVFATEHGGAAPKTDPLLLKGVVLKMLGAARKAKRFYAELCDDPRYQSPIAWGDLDATAYDGLLLPGGHAKGMRQYLGSETLQRIDLLPAES